MPNLNRFINQQKYNAAAKEELQNGYKESHWMWWEMPQIAGLGRTSTSREYAIQNLEEAKECHEPRL